MAQESGFFFDFAMSPKQSLGEMTLLHRSTSGAFELYRACKDGSNRVFKALKAEHRGNPIYEAMLRKEYQIGYGLEHQSICRTYSFTSIPSVGNSIELEWIDGRTLGEYLAEKPGRNEVVRVFCDICSALEYIHRRQVIHRDLKPENIMVTFNGDNVKLLDFGVSDTDSNAVLKAPAGTFDYASPELVSGEEIDLRSDIWSLGKIMRTYGLYPGIASRCMQRIPERRYRSASDVRDAIENRHRRWIWFSVSIVFIMALLGFFLFSRKGIADGDYYFDSATESILNADSRGQE